MAQASLRLGLGQVSSGALSSLRQALHHVGHQATIADAG
jgi:hypothetical protein